MRSARVYDFPRTERIEQVEDARRLAALERHIERERAVHRERMHLHTRWERIGLAVIAVMGAPLFLIVRPDLGSFVCSCLFGCVISFMAFHAYRHDWHARRFRDE